LDVQRDVIDGLCCIRLDQNKVLDRNDV